MTDDRTFALVADERRRLADRLDTLPPGAWELATGCGDWTVREVAGHLTAGWNVSIPRFVLGLVRARGSFHRANARFGRELGARPPAEIVADLRANAEHRFTPPGAGPEAPLSDVLVHSHDIGAAVGWTVEVDPAVTVLVMDRAVAPSAARITGGQIAEGYSLRADDVTWRHDQPGRPTLSGPVRDLLLVVFGRLPIDHLDQHEPLS
ncbi:MAG: maleylpyruvate isomerase family mycothiol-dependent enzyme [Actinomycetota bacterium]